jgi:hypothetical protein
MRKLLTITLLLLIGSTAYSQVLNLSTRGQVGAGENILIGGFILDRETTVIVRGLGPTLLEFDPTFQVLQDPMVAIADEAGNILCFNDDWTTDPKASEFGDLAPRNAKEAAMKVTLPVGNYTVLLIGYRNGTGLGLVEMYFLP